MRSQVQSLLVLTALLLPVMAARPSHASSCRDLFLSREAKVRELAELYVQINRGKQPVAVGAQVLFDQILKALADHYGEPVIRRELKTAIRNLSRKAKTDAAKSDDATEKARNREEEVLSIPYRLDFREDMDFWVVEENVDGGLTIQDSLRFRLLFDDSPRGFHFDTALLKPSPKRKFPKAEFEKPYDFRDLEVAKIEGYDMNFINIKVQSENSFVYRRLGGEDFKHLRVDKAALGVSPDGKRLAIAMYDSGMIYLRVYNAFSGAVIAELPPFESQSPKGLYFSPDGNQLLLQHMIIKNPSSAPAMNLRAFVIVRDL